MNQIMTLILRYNEINSQTQSHYRTSMETVASDRDQFVFIKTKKNKLKILYSLTIQLDG